MGQFVPIAVGSLNGDMVVRAAFGSYVDPTYQQQWAVENIVSIRNHRLDKEYRSVAFVYNKPTTKTIYSAICR